MNQNQVPNDWKVESLDFKDKLNIVTHDGKFHADEVTAVALILIFINTQKGISVIRTRNQGAFKDANFVVDLGEKYDGVKYFDHHHFDKTDEDYGFSSAGLMMAFINVPQDKYKSLDFLLDEVDENDIGEKRHAGNHFCGIINSFNADDVYSDEQNLQFDKAVTFTVDYICNLLRGEDIKVEQKKLEEVTRPRTIDGVDIVVMAKEDIFVPTSLFLEKADIVIQYDNHKGLWTAQTVNLSRSEFGSKYKILSSGRESEDFCHKAGFISSMKDEDGVVHLKVQTGTHTKDLKILL